METPTIMWIVYLMNQVDVMRDVVSALSGMLSIIVVVAFFVFAVSEGTIKTPRFARWCIGVLTVLLILFNLFLPTSETMKQIAVAYGVSEVLQSDQAKEMGDKIVALSGKASAVIEKNLDKALEEK